MTQLRRTEGFMQQERQLAQQAGDRAPEVQTPWFDALSCVTAQRTSKERLSHEGVLLGGWREGEPLLSVEARRPAICAGKRG